MASQRPNIWKLQASKDVEGLTSALNYSDPDIRKAAAAALRVIGEARAVAALKLALVRERHVEVRDHLTAAIEHLEQIVPSADHKTKSREDWVRQLSSPDAEVVIQAAQSLGDLGDQLATESLVIVFRNALLRDDVRLAAAQALLKLKSAPAVVTLLAGLVKDNWRIRHNSATVLGQVKATWATEPLINLLNDEHPNVRLASASALSRLQTPRAMQALELYKLQRTGQTKPLPMSVVVGSAVGTAPLPALGTEAAKEKDVPSSLSGNVGSADPAADTLAFRPSQMRELLQRRQQQINEAKEKKAGTGTLIQRMMVAPPKPENSNASADTRELSPSEVVGDADPMADTLAARSPALSQLAKDVKSVVEEAKKTAETKQINDEVKLTSAEDGAASPSFAPTVDPASE